MSTSFRLLLPRQLLNEMIAQAQAELPNECCGILAGTIGADGIARVSHRYGLVNALASPTEFEWEAKSSLAAHRSMRTAGTEILAIYHSHPTGQPIPSQKDRDRYAEARPILGDVMHFIVGLQQNEPVVRAWWLTEAASREADWQVLP